MPPKAIWLNDKLVPPAQANINVYDHGLLYGDGVFEGIRIYNGRIFKLATHLRRLYASAKAIRLDIPYTADELTKAVHETVKFNGLPNGYIRLCVTRGVGTLGLNPNNCERPSVFIIADLIALYPREMYEKGMSVITSSVTRNHPNSVSPRIKSLNYLNNILAKIEAIDAGVPEALMLNAQGFIAEATADNIFIVRHKFGKPVLQTPPLHAGTLEGVTMDTVIELAHKAGIQLERVDMTRHDIYTADEMFLTGTGAEIISVTKVDGRVIGSGEPGPISRKLIGAFHELVAHHAPED